jgi:PadR family transcriptional regulator PadR
MEDSRELFEKWRSQSRKGFIELCVLSAIHSGGRGYGLDLMTRLSLSGLEVTEGTLYPLLMRMTREGSLESSWTTPDTGHPRKYYRLSEAGRALFAAMRVEYAKNAVAYGMIGKAGEE